nr:hypothetical protein Iba_chr03aCG4810 [Ipomoea batatas]
MKPDITPSGGRRSSDHRPHSHPQQPKPDDDALLRVLLRLGGGGGGNEAETLGERHDGGSIGEVRHRGGAANPTKIGANLTKIEEIRNQHRAISKGPSMKGASTGWPHWAVESQASDLVMSIAFFVLFQIGSTGGDDWRETTDLRELSTGKCETIYRHGTMDLEEPSVAKDP